MSKKAQSSSANESDVDDGTVGKGYTESDREADENAGNDESEEEESASSSNDDQNDDRRRQRSSSSSVNDDAVASSAPAEATSSSSSSSSSSASSADAASSKEPVTQTEAPRSESKQTEKSSSGKKKKMRIPRKRKLTVVRAARSSAPASNNQSNAQSAAAAPSSSSSSFSSSSSSSSSSAPSSRARSHSGRPAQERRWKSCSSIKPHDEFLVWFHSNEYNRYKSMLKAIHVDSHGECWLNGRKLARSQYPSPPVPPTTHGERAAMGDPLYAPSYNRSSGQLGDDFLLSSYYMSAYAEFVQFQSRLHGGMGDWRKNLPPPVNPNFYCSDSENEWLRNNCIIDDLRALEPYADAFRCDKQSCEAQRFHISQAPLTLWNSVPAQEKENQQLEFLAYQAARNARLSMPLMMQHQMLAPSPMFAQANNPPQRQSPPHYYRTRASPPRHNNTYFHEHSSRSFENNEDGEPTLASSSRSSVSKRASARSIHHQVRRCQCPLMRRMTSIIHLVLPRMMSMHLRNRNRYRVHRIRIRKIIVTVVMSHVRASMRKKNHQTRRLVLSVVREAMKVMQVSRETRKVKISATSRQMMRVGLQRTTVTINTSTISRRVMNHPVIHRIIVRNGQSARISRPLPSNHRRDKSRQ